MTAGQHKVTSQRCSPVSLTRPAVLQLKNGTSEGFAVINWLANRIFEANTGGPGRLQLPDDRGLQRCRPPAGRLRPAETPRSIAQSFQRPWLTWKQATRKACCLRSKTRCASCNVSGAPTATRQAAELYCTGAPCGTAGCKSSLLTANRRAHLVDDHPAAEVVHARTRC